MYLTQKEETLLKLCSLSEWNTLEAQHFRILVRDKHVNINCTEKSNCHTPLLLLCHHNKKSNKLCEYIKFLLQSKMIDVNAKSNDGWDALQTICLRHGGKRLLEIVELLIQRGINVKK